MKIFIKSKNNNYLATICIGLETFRNWKKYSFPSWKLYCKRNDIGLIVFDKNLISEDHPNYKKPTWQKLLIGNKLKENFKSAKNICYLDSDIIINPFSPNIFNFYKKKNYFGIISLRNNLPYKYFEVLKKIAYNRNKYYSNNYPLNSSLFLSLKDLFKNNNLQVQKDEFCAGVFLFNVRNHSAIMFKWFHLYDKSVKSITNGGDQTHLNFHIQNSKKVLWLDYKFQSIWIYEMAHNYPFLYKKNIKVSNIVECVYASLANCFFLHFAGSWPESQMWKTYSFFKHKKDIKMFSKMMKYFKLKKIKSEIKGPIYFNK